MPHEGIPHDVGLSGLDFTAEQRDEADVLIEALLGDESFFRDPAQQANVRNSPQATEYFVYFWLSEKMTPFSGDVIDALTNSEFKFDYTNFIQFQANELFLAAGMELNPEPGEDEPAFIPLTPITESILRDFNDAVLNEYKDSSFFHGANDAIHDKEFLLPGEEILSPGETGSDLVSDLEWDDLVQKVVDEFGLGAMEFLVGDKQKWIRAYSGEFGNQTILEFGDWFILNNGRELQEIEDEEDLTIRTNDRIISEEIRKEFGTDLSSIQNEFLHRTLINWMARERLKDATTRKRDLWNQRSNKVKREVLDTALRIEFAGIENSEALFTLLEANGDSISTFFLSPSQSGRFMDDFVATMDNYLTTRSADGIGLGRGTGPEDINIAAFINQNFSAAVVGLDPHMSDIFIDEMIVRLRPLLNQLNIRGIDSENRDELLEEMRTNPRFNPVDVLDEAIIDRISGIGDSGVRDYLLNLIMREGGSPSAIYRSLDIEDAVNSTVWEIQVTEQFKDLVPESVAPDAIPQEL